MFITTCIKKHCTRPLNALYMHFKQLLSAEEAGRLSPCILTRRYQNSHFPGSDKDQIKRDVTHNFSTLSPHIYMPKHNLK